MRTESAAGRRETSLAFACLLAFTFILLIAPQTFVPGLADLSPAKATMALGIAATAMGRLGAGQPLVVWRPESKLVLGLWLWGALSILWSAWRGGSYELLTNDFGKSVVLFFVITAVVDSAQRLKTLIGSMVLWGVIGAGIVIRDYFQGALSFGRVVGFDSPLLANPNDAALMFNLLLALSIGLLAITPSSTGRALLIAAMAVFILGVIVTFSRGGFIGLLVLAAVLALREWRRQRSRLVMLAGLGALVGLLMPSGYGARLSSIYDFARDETGSAAARWDLMIGGAKLMLTNPVGVGLGQDVLGLRDQGLATWNNIHNVYLQIGVDLGVVGLGIFLLLCWRLVRGLQVSLPTLPGGGDAGVLRALGRGVQIALLVLLVEMTLHPIAYNFYFYYIAGFAVAVHVMAEDMARRAHRARPGGGAVPVAARVT